MPSSAMMRSRASIVGRDSLGRPFRNPSAMNSGVRPAAFFCLQTAESAPLAASNPTTVGKLP